MRLKEDCLNDMTACLSKEGRAVFCNGTPVGAWVFQLKRWSVRSPRSPSEPLEQAPLPPANAECSVEEA
jgi:hypothetical protein